MATFSAAIAAGADDAEESESGVVNTTSTLLDMDEVDNWVGMRFLSVTIPQGATINSASINVHIPGTTRDDINQTIHGEDTDNAAAFVESANNLSSRTTTTATVVWNAPSLGIGTHASPDIATIVQEIVDRPGWSSGNAMVFLWTFLTGSDCLVTAYENTNFNPASLDIDYTPAASGGVPVKAMYYARMRS